MKLLKTLDALTRHNGVRNDGLNIAISKEVSTNHVPIDIAVGSFAYIDKAHNYMICSNNWKGKADYGEYKIKIRSDVALTALFSKNKNGYQKMFGVLPTIRARQDKILDVTGKAELKSVWENSDVINRPELNYSRVHKTLDIESKDFKKQLTAATKGGKNPGPLNKCAYIKLLGTVVKAKSILSIKPLLYNGQTITIECRSDDTTSMPMVITGSDWSFMIAPHWPYSDAEQFKELKLEGGKK